MKSKNIILSIFMGFTIGSFSLILFSAFQKCLIGVNPLIVKGYLVPFCFGGISGATVAFFWYRSKILSIKKAHAEERAITDKLTTLYNRRGFFTLAEHQIKMAKRNHKKFLLIYADIDNLKNINDTLGHRQGDIAIIETSKILKRTFRKSDIIARVGGDEFVIFPINAGENNYEKIINHLKINLEKFNQKNKEFKLSISTGKAVYNPENPKKINRILCDADKKMYEEKLRKKQNFSNNKTEVI